MCLCVCAGTPTRASHASHGHQPGRGGLAGIQHLCVLTTRRLRACFFWLSKLATFACLSLFSSETSVSSSFRSLQFPTIDIPAAFPPTSLVYCLQYHCILPQQSPVSLHTAPAGSSITAYCPSSLQYHCILPQQAPVSLHTAPAVSSITAYCPSSLQYHCILPQ